MLYFVIGCLIIGLFISFSIGWWYGERNVRRNSMTDNFLPRCECGNLMRLTPCTGTIDKWFYKCDKCGKTNKLME